MKKTNIIKWIVQITSCVWIPLIVFTKLGTTNFLGKFYHVYNHSHETDIVGLVEHNGFKLLICISFFVNLFCILWLKDIVEWIKNRE